MRFYFSMLLVHSFNYDLNGINCLEFEKEHNRFNVCSYTWYWNESFWLIGYKLIIIRCKVAFRIITEWSPHDLAETTLTNCLAIKLFVLLFSIWKTKLRSDCYFLVNVRAIIIQIKCVWKMRFWLRHKNIEAYLPHPLPI